MVSLNMELGKVDRVTSFQLNHTDPVATNDNETWSQQNLTQHHKAIILQLKYFNHPSPKNIVKLL